MFIKLTKIKIIIKWQTYIANNIQVPTPKFKTIIL